MIKLSDLRLDRERDAFYLRGKLYSGQSYLPGTEMFMLKAYTLMGGRMWGLAREYDESGNLLSIESLEVEQVGYGIKYRSYADVFTVWYKSELIELISVDRTTGKSETYLMPQQEIAEAMADWAEEMSDFEREHDSGFMKYYREQEALAEWVESQDRLNEHVRYVAGADVAYDEEAQQMAGGIVVLDAGTLEVVDRAVHVMPITFPYVPGLFSFREVPPLVEAYDMLKVKPELIVCDGHGVAHPKGAGMASHLGLELDVPTIGCAKSRLIGSFAMPGSTRGSSSPMMIGEREVGRVLRTQDGVHPMYVSVGHRVSLDTACAWVLRLASKYRQPETTRAADALVRAHLKTVTDIGYPEE